jgi:uncharacterized membrane protein YgcG
MHTLLLLFMFVGTAGFPPHTGLVTDAAGVLTTEEHAALEAKLEALEQSTSVEFAVVTVTSLDGMTIDEYKTALFNAWGIGKRGKNNGLLLVIAPTEGKRGKVGIEVGYGLEPLLTDGVTGSITRSSIVPGWRSDHRANGIIAGVDAFIAKIGEAPKSAAAPEVTSAVTVTSSEPDDSTVFWLFMLVGGLVVVVGFLYSWLRKKDKEDWQNRVISSYTNLEPYPPTYTVPVKHEGKVAKRVSTSASSYTPYSEPSHKSYSYDDSSRYSSSSSSSSDSSPAPDFGGGSSGGAGSSSDL